MEGFIIYSIIILFCAFIFIGLGIFAWKKETPMHFWSGTEVKAEEISNIRAYNIANGLMWMIYGFAFIIASILGLILGYAVGIALVILLCSLGIIALVIVYRYIYKKYKV
ncbi:MAG TPA: hypothetical protein DEF42_18955 [Desulfosporosinus sp.]|nr:hypothetical protein [Desulfosporosinus sp.]